MGTSFKLAKEKSKRLIVRQTVAPFSISIQDLTATSGGQGIALFFLFLKFATIAFGVMSLFTIYSLILLVTNDGLYENVSLSTFDYNAYIAMLSIGNINKFDKEGDSDLSFMLDSLMIVDFINCIIFLLFYIWFVKYSKKIKKSRRLLVSQYVLEVSGFPKNIIHSDDIKSFFENKGYEISECYLARQYNGTLLFYQQIVDTYQKLQEAKEEQKENELKSNKIKLWFIKTFPNQFDKVVKLQKKFDKLQQTVSDKVLKNNKLEYHKEHDQYNSVVAYVVFKYQRDKVKAYKQFIQYSGKIIKSSVPNDMLFEDEHILKVQKRVDEPSCLKWENLEVSNAERYAKSWLVSFYLFFFIVLCFSMIIFVNLLKPEPETNLCTKEEWENAEINWYFIYPEIQDEKCSKAFFNCINGVLISFVISTFVFGVNTMLKRIIKGFINFMRYSHISQEIKASTNQIFRAQLVNTGLLMTILQFNFQGFKFPQGIVELASIIGFSNMNEVTYVDDFTRDFYTDIGGKIVITTLMLIATPIFITVFLVPFFQKVRDKVARKKKTQYEMNKALIPPQFDLATYYAQILNTIFITMIYSSGIPFLNIIAFLALLSQYLTLKYQILRFSKKPEDLDNSVNKNILNILPVALFFHLIIGIFVYSTQDIIPFSSQGNVNSLTSGILDIIGYNSEDNYFVLIKRLLYNTSYTIFAVLVLVFYLVFIKLFKHLQRLVKNKKSGDYDEEALNPQSYEETKEQLSEYGLASYNIRDNPYYTFLVQQIDDSAQQEDLNLDEEEKKQMEEEKMKKLLEDQQKVQEKEDQKMYKKEKIIYANQEYAAEKAKEEEEKQQQNEEFKQEELDFEEMEQNLEKLSDYQDSDNEDKENLKKQLENAKKGKKKFRFFQSDNQNGDQDAVSISESQVEQMQQQQGFSSYSQQKLGFNRKNKRNNKIVPLEEEGVTYFWKSQKDVNEININKEQEKINTSNNLITQQSSQNNLDKSNVIQDQQQQQQNDKNENIQNDNLSNVSSKTNLNYEKQQNQEQNLLNSSSRQQLITSNKNQNQIKEKSAKQGNRNLTPIKSQKRRSQQSFNLLNNHNFQNNNHKHQQEGQQNDFSFQNES